MALQGEIRKMEQLIAQGSRQVDHLNNQKDEYLKEIKELRRGKHKEAEEGYYLYGNCACLMSRAPELTQ